MLYDLDETIKAILRDRGGLLATEIDIAFDAPDRDWAARINRPTVNCYLYDIRENLELRQTGWETMASTNGRSGTKRQPPRWFDMSYVCTAWTNDVEDEHHLLWRVLATFVRFPELPRDQLQGRLQETEQPIRTQVAQPNGLLRNPAEVWSALENRIRPSVNYQLTLPLDATEPIEAPLVISTRITIGPMPAAGSDDLLQIGGTVRDPAGHAVPNVTVGVVGHALSATTDATGRFTLSRLAAGRYTLVATLDGRRAERSVEVPGGDFDLFLTEPGRERERRPTKRT